MSEAFSGTCVLCAVYLSPLLVVASRQWQPQAMNVFSDDGLEQFSIQFLADWLEVLIIALRESPGWLNHRCEI